MVATPRPNPTHHQSTAFATHRLTRYENHRPQHKLRGPIVVQWRGFIEIERRPVHVWSCLLLLSYRNALFLDAGGLVFGIEHIVQSGAIHRFVVELAHLVWMLGHQFLISL